MNYTQATKAYTRWLAGQVKPDARLFQAQLEEKDKKMEKGAFPFLRGTFYRWAELWPKVCPALAACRQDMVMAVGDLHIENFGTWRDAEHRLVWGVNDFDEAHEMAFTSDLVRLATSALAAAEDFSFSLQADEATATVLGVYRAGCARGGAPFILESAHQTLRLLIDHALTGDGVGKFWKKLRKAEDYPLSSPGQPVPDSVRRLLRASLPKGMTGIEYRVVTKAKGLGSLGRPRFLAVGEWQGETVAREIKRLTPSAVEWLTDPQSTRLFARRVAHLEVPFRSPDPTYAIRKHWVVRALDPDAVKVELDTLPKGMKMRAAILYLLDHMGMETANIHLGSAPAARLLGSVERWEKQSPAFLAEATTKMWEATQQDRKSFS